MRIEEAKKLLKNMTPVTNKKQALLQEIKDDILDAIRNRNKLSAIYAQLKRAGYIGSLATLKRTVKAWTENSNNDEQKQKAEEQPTSAQQIKQKIMKKVETGSKEFADKRSSYDDDNI